MSDEVLTPEEKQAIAESVQTSDSTEVVDLTQGDRTLRRRIREINPAVQRFGRAIREVVLRVLGLVDDAPESSPELIGPAKAIQEVVSSPASLRIQVAGDDVGFVVLDAITCFALVEHAFGTGFERETTWTPPTRASLTEIERAAIHDVLDRVAKAVSEVLHATLPDNFEIRCKWTDVTASAFDGVDIALLVKAPIQIGNQLGYGALIGLPGIVDVLGGNSLDLEETRHWVLEGVKESPVDFIAVLGRVALSMDELEALRVGDVMWLDSGRSEPIDVEIQDVAKFRAEPVHRNGMLSVELVSEVS
ncbi:MAG: FliM/FliN family flagellar motor switch protein [Myxococcota bacterium]